jgi:hypothetical protein
MDLGFVCMMCHEDIRCERSMRMKMTEGRKTLYAHHLA